MSPRKHRRQDETPDREIRGPARNIEEQPDGDFVVQLVTGSASTKVYRCPGCDHEIPRATPHTVAWPVDDIDDRRHWHTACWKNRTKRGPKVQRTRNAPRY